MKIQRVETPAHQATMGPRAWLTYTVIDTTGARSNAVSADAIVVGAVSVSESMPATVEARGQLLQSIGDIATSSLVPKGRPALFVLPAGYYGYDAGTGESQYLKWPLQRRVHTATLKALMRFPVGTVLAVGMDSYVRPPPGAPVLQAALVGERLGGGAILHTVVRGETALENRIFSVGGAKAAFFVCGEFTGSRTENNGPYLVDSAGRRRYLDDAGDALRGCSILVDLAHRRIPAPVGVNPSPRMVHRGRMNDFSASGAAVLAHHHRGSRVKGRPHSKHRSNWIVFRGGRWIEEAAVTELP